MFPRTPHVPRTNVRRAEERSRSGWNKPTYKRAFGIAVVVVRKARGALAPTHCRRISYAVCSFETPERQALSRLELVF